ncbi:tyrosine-type recombinase/integrase [Cryobacterium zhongshanensis]|uniref:Site-specific integrase n=1 Tax=Cryobacterium zhongshanensis TaxID=2928153 RepID=A0AA41QV71_9MICO|nr:site-specific integrase [Cryobacterium zhongshanensis]MCI4657319.1 site-specific integrase [Cryobacterium zhongshanensis]
MSEHLEPPRWRVWFTSRSAASAADERIVDWLNARSTPDARPFLIGPDGTYDSELNAYFEAMPFVRFAPDTQEAVARDIARFLTFVSWTRGSIGDAGPSTEVWRSASESDRAAYYQWRNVDLKGPRVAASTWNREVATVSGFYRWMAIRQVVSQSPIAVREHRRGGRWGHNSASRMAAPTPLEVRPDRKTRSIAWLTADQFRLWRDVGLRGYGVTGRRDQSFRGTLAGRNGVYADLMVRTGLRLTEQSSLLVSELPARTAGNRFGKFWLSGSVAKNNSARDVYIPDQTLGAISAYLAERAIFVRSARTEGAYEKVVDRLVTDERGRTAVDMNGEQHDVSSLTPDERRRLFVDTRFGLEPAMLWLSQKGSPLSPNSWQNAFASANDRCLRLGLAIRCHPHALRHTYAVRTLEQLQRGHIDALSRQNFAQRRHYAMVFGDPLNWVRIRLGHRSIETTMVYLHSLAELEFETRLALVGSDDDWDVPDESEVA